MSGGAPSGRTMCERRVRILTHITSSKLGPPFVPNEDRESPGAVGAGSGAMYIRGRSECGAVSEALGAGQAEGSPRRRRSRIWGAVAVGAIVATVALVIVLTSETAPPNHLNQSAVALGDVVSVGPGVAGSVFFPFQATPGPGTSGDANSGVVNASLAIQVAETGCGSASASCPGLVLEIMTPAQLQSYQTNGQASPLWCYGGTAGSCGSATGTTALSVDLSHEAGAPLDLVIANAAPAGSAVSVSVTATLFWTS